MILIVCLRVGCRCCGLLLLKVIVDGKIAGLWVVRFEWVLGLFCVVLIVYGLWLVTWVCLEVMRICVF